LFFADQESHNMKRSTSRTLLVICAALFCAQGATAVWAADASKALDTCASCHNKDGVSTESEIPTIAGYSAPYISETLGGYAKKDRPCPETKFRSGPDKGKASDMCNVAGALSEDEIEQVAKYFSGKKFVRAKQNADPVLATKGEVIHTRNCEKCHSENGSSADDDSGMLAGQWMPYLKQTLADFKAGKRPIGKKMKPKIDALKPEDFDALVNYYGSFK
jgi:sulfide dehydrogenase cytochrome subunit